MDIQHTINKVILKDTNFADLMKERIYNVLLYASHYDAFILEEDGRIDELVFNEYHALNLRNAPRFTLASTKEDVYRQLESNSFELIIMMPNADIVEAFNGAKDIKAKYPSIPIVGLTPYAGDIDERMAKEDMSALDYTFCWLGNPDLLLAIVKMLEDKKNMDSDVEAVGVQGIILVEDSIHYMSYFLPLIYKFIFSQSLSFFTEGLNSHEKMLRMRGRPKLFLCNTYEEATETYLKYKDNILGVITDARYPKGDDVEYEFAGKEFCEFVRSHNKYLPLIMQSAEMKNAAIAEGFHAQFIHKNSKMLANEMGNALKSKFGFGDLIFPADEHQKDCIVINNIRDLQHNIYNVSSEALLDKFSRNEISRWFYSRAIFPIAEYLKVIELDQLSGVSEARDIIYDAIINYRKKKNRGIIAEFDKDKFDQYSNFQRIGQGSLGGKARGLAFLNLMFKKHEFIFDEYQNVTIEIPRTVVICSDIFDDFMASNNLMPLALNDTPDDELLAAFLNAKLSTEMMENIRAFISNTTNPIAVRSSSLMEDSHYYPFAGNYSTYMITQQNSIEDTTDHVAEAIKAVMASVYYRHSKQYLEATNSNIKEEKMCVILQEVVGQKHDNWFYPSFSGVGKSLNHYPTGSEESTDGVVNIAFGLGKQIVDGSISLRFSPIHPLKNLQTSTLKIALSDTQKDFYAINLNWQGNISTDECFNISHLPISEAENHGSLQYIASTYKYRDQMMADNLFDKGMRVITFNNILKHNAMPLAKICDKILKMGEAEMGCPVEIEFAVNLSYTKEPHQFHLLQIRPITKFNTDQSDTIEKTTGEEVIIYSEHTIGCSFDTPIHDILYVKTDSFDKSKTELIATEIEQVNNLFSENKQKFLLIGPGRWGSSDSWLGVPVKWSQISNAKVIVETSLKGFTIPPSEGSHFFQNVMAARAAYLSVNQFLKKQECYNEDLFESMEIIHETEYIRHVRCAKPLKILINGIEGRGLISVD